jgi:hypothetical protein
VALPLLAAFNIMAIALLADLVVRRTATDSGEGPAPAP